MATFFLAAQSIKGLFLPAVGRNQVPVDEDRNERILEVMLKGNVTTYGRTRGFLPRGPVHQRLVLACNGVELESGQQQTRRTEVRWGTSW